MRSNQNLVTMSITEIKAKMKAIYMDYEAYNCLFEAIRTLVLLGLLDDKVYDEVYAYDGILYEQEDA